MDLHKRLALVVALSACTEGAIAQTTPEPAPFATIGEGWPVARITEDGKGVSVLCIAPDASERPADYHEEHDSVYCEGHTLGKTTSLTLMTESDRLAFFIRTPAFPQGLASRCLSGFAKRDEKAAGLVFICR